MSSHVLCGPRQQRWLGCATLRHLTMHPVAPPAYVAGNIWSCLLQPSALLWCKGWEEGGGEGHVLPVYTPGKLGDWITPPLHGHHCRTACLHCTITRCCRIIIAYWGHDTRRAKRKRGGGGLNKGCVLSPELAAFLGEETMTRPQVLRLALVPAGCGV